MWGSVYYEILSSCQLLCLLLGQTGDCAISITSGATNARFPPEGVVRRPVIKIHTLDLRLDEPSHHTVTP